MENLIDSKVVAEYCRRFNAQDNEPYQGDIPNSCAEEFMVSEIPRFDSPDPVFNEIWFFRWWSFRKHIRSTPFGRVVLEFMPDVPWAGPFNTINCPAAHQLRESRWLHDKSVAEEYLAFWLNPESQAAVCRYTFGPASSALALVSVSGNIPLLKKLYRQLCGNYGKWNDANLRRNGLFYQTDNLDGMECSIGGSGYRVTINSCMAAEAEALSVIANLCGDQEKAGFFDEKYRSLRQRLESRLWNDEKAFFMTRNVDNEEFVNVRELHGYTPWYYFQDMEEKFDCA